MELVPYCGRTNIRPKRHSTKLSHPGDLAPGISAFLVYAAYVNLLVKTYALERTYRRISNY
jgi:hypothetical protein